MSTPVTPLALLLTLSLMAPQDTTWHDARRDPGVPMSRLTPGTILTRRRALFCVSGYAAQVRSVSAKRRDSVFVRYAIPTSARKGYVIDHLIPLELGGSNRITNLFPQDTTSARRKDRAESWAKREACSGRQAVRPLQRAMASNWHDVLGQVPKGYRNTSEVPDR